MPLGSAPRPSRPFRAPRLAPHAPCAGRLSRLRAGRRLYVLDPAAARDAALEGGEGEPTLLALLALPGMQGVFGGGGAPGGGGASPLAARLRRALGAEGAGAQAQEALVAATRRLGNALNEAGKSFPAGSSEAEAAWRQAAAEFAGAGDGANEALLRCNVAQLLRQRGTGAVQAGGLGARGREAYAGAVGMCETALACVGGRRCAPGVWALVHGEFARTARAFAADLRSDMDARRAAGAGPRGLREDGQLVSDLLLRAAALLTAVGDARSHLALAETHLELGAWYQSAAGASADVAVEEAASSGRMMSRTRFEAAEVQAGKAAALAGQLLAQYEAAGACAAARAEARGLLVRAAAQRCQLARDPRAARWLPRVQALRAAARAMEQVGAGASGDAAGAPLPAVAAAAGVAAARALARDLASGAGAGGGAGTERDAAGAQRELFRRALAARDDGADLASLARDVARAAGAAAAGADAAAGGERHEGGAR